MIMNGVVVSIIGRDRKGLLAEIAAAIADAGGNIEEIRGHTIFLQEGKKIVSLSLIVTDEDVLDLYKQLKERLKIVAEKLGLKINIYLLGDILQQ